MDKVSEAREKMIERVKAAAISKDKSQKQKDCLHNYATFRETIQADNRKYKGTGSYFIVKGCVKCFDKKRIQLVVE